MRGTTEHVLLAGCRDEELSHEYLSPETRMWQGATTYYLLKALQQYHSDLTWREVHSAVQVQVNAVYNRQLPQLEGPGNRKVFGGMAAPESPHLLVTEVEADGPTLYVKINGGAAVGLTEGSQIALYPAGNDDMTGRPLATGIVEQTKVDHVWSRLETAIEADSIAIPSRVKITALGYEGLVYPVGIDDETVRTALKEGKNGLSPFLSIVDGADPGAQFRVVVQQDRYVIQDGGGTQIVTQSQPLTVEGAAEIARNLEHLAIYNNVRKLRNPTPLPALEEGVGLEVVSYTRAGFTGPQDGIPLDPMNSVLTPGRKVWVTVRNNTSETLYISLFNLSSNYGIFRISPDRAPHHTVAAGGSFFVDALEPEIHNPFVTQTREVFKVFATREPQSFDVLELPELNQPQERGKTRSGGPLADLLNGIRSDGTRKMVRRRDDTHERWITKQVEITALADNQVQSLADGETTVELGSPLEITLEKPAGFAGDLIFSSVTQLSRGSDIEAPIQLPPGLNNPDAEALFQPLSLSGSTRDATASAGVLALNTTPQMLEAITAENPLRLELTVEEEPDLAGILPVAFDGEFFYLAGQQAEPRSRSLSAAGRERMAVEITYLPSPFALPESEDGAPATVEAPTRDLKRTVRLFLYKVYTGSLPADTGLRKATRAADGSPIYTPIQPGEIAQGSRVALLIHGFTSDTGWFVERALPFLDEIGHYDLYLTYDYETFNTAIEENGVMLARALQRLGFGPDDGIHLDIFSHSMGSQVARVLVELQGGDAYVDRLFMGGSPNAGTRLAEAKKLIFWLGTVALNHAGATPPALIANWFLKKSVDSAVSMEDLMPSSALYKALNDATHPIDVRYYVQIGTNAALDQAIDWKMLFSKTGLMKLVDAGLDQLLDGANDLAVGVTSARSVRHGNWPHLQIEQLPGNHFDYFFTEESVAALKRWMEG
jgi:pimeloyl-ACP methyl ester carboxylesterase